MAVAFKYAGQVYVRPMGRGVALEAPPYNGNGYLEDAAPQGHHYLEAAFYKTADDAPQFVFQDEDRLQEFVNLVRQYPTEPAANLYEMVTSGK